MESKPDVELEAEATTPTDITNQLGGWKQLKDELKSIPGSDEIIFLVRSWEKNEIRLARYLNRCVFLKRCKKNYIIPAYISASGNSVRSKRFLSLKDKMDRLVLDEDIKKAYKTTQDLRLEIEKTKTALSSRIPDFINWIQQLIEGKRKIIFENHKTILITKFNELITGQKQEIEEGEIVEEISLVWSPPRGEFVTLSV